MNQSIKFAIKRGNWPSFTGVPFNLDITIWLNLYNCTFLAALPSVCVNNMSTWEVVFAAHWLDPLSDDLVTLEVGWVLAMLAGFSSLLGGETVLPRRLLYILNPVEVSHLRCVDTLIKADGRWSAYTGSKVISDGRLIIARVKEIAHRTIVLWACWFSRVVRGLFV